MYNIGIKFLYNYSMNNSFYYVYLMNPIVRQKSLTKDLLKKLFVNAVPWAS